MQLEEQITSLKAEMKAQEAQRLEAQISHDKKTEELQAQITVQKEQHSEAQRSHEEELQGMRQTMHMAVDQLRSSQVAYEAKLAKAAADLTAAQADADQHAENLARQLGQSDFALRQLKSEADSLPSLDKDELPQDDTDKLQQAAVELETLQQELQALRAQLTLSQDEQVSKAQAAAAEHAELKSRIHHLEAQLERADLQHQPGISDSASLRGNLQRQLTAGQKENAQLVRQVSELQQQVESIDIRIESSQSELKSELETARAELADLQDKLASSQHQQQDVLQQVSDQAV